MRRQRAALAIIQKLSIPKKLVLIAMTTTIIGLLVAGTAFMVYDRYRVKQTMVQDLSALAMLIADRSNAALLFDDPNLARENLASLRVKSSVTGACIYGENGSVFAFYKAVGTSAETFPAPEHERLHRFDPRRLVVFEPMVFEGKRIGSVCIQADLAELDAVWKNYLAATVLIMLGSGLAAFVLSSYLQKIVSEPITNLTRTAQLIALRKDYSVRADQEKDNDLGVLVQAFNGMLETIEAQNSELVENNRYLEQHVAERTLEFREAKERAEAISDEQRAIFESATTGIVLLRDRIIVRCNRKLDEIFGYAAGELVGKTTRVWFPDDESYTILGNEIYEEMALGEMRLREQQLQRKDGTRFWARLCGQALDKSDPFKGAVAIIEDITDEREATEALRAAKERAETADQLKSAFLATMSHELRTPLNSIIGFTGILLQGLSGPINEEQAKQLGMVKKSANHLLSLISDVLDISKIEAGQLNVDREPFDLPESIRKVVQSVRPLAEKKGLELSIDVANDVGLVTSDVRRVEQVLLNLLSNALKFTEQGCIRVSCLREGEYYLTSVTDTGIGIKDGDLERLFKPFHQIDSGLSRKYEGTGLGLSICKKLVELMGGEVGAESSPGKGSTFWFSLKADIGDEQLCSHLPSPDLRDEQKIPESVDQTASELKMKPTSPQAAVSVSVDREKLEFVSHKLALLLRGDDISAEDLFDVNREMLKTAFPRDFFNIEGAIRRFDFETALAALERAMWKVNSHD